MSSIAHQGFVHLGMDVSKDSPTGIRFGPCLSLRVARNWSREPCCTLLHADGRGSRLSRNCGGGASWNRTSDLSIIREVMGFPLGPNRSHSFSVRPGRRLTERSARDPPGRSGTLRDPIVGTELGRAPGRRTAIARALSELAHSRDTGRR